MLFYASLFVVCIITACILLWMFRSLREVGTAVYRAFLPSHKGNVKAARLTHLSSHLDSTPTPWGWDSSSSRVKAKPHRVAQPVSKGAPVPSGWRSHQRKTLASRAKKSAKRHLDRSDFTEMFENVRSTVGVADTVEHQFKIGWPYREESFDFEGSNYKSSRKREKTDAGALKNAKPWGW